MAERVLLMSRMGTLVNFIRSPFGLVQSVAPVPLQGSAYVRTVQDQQPRLAMQTLQMEQFIAAADAYTLGNPALMGRIADALLQTDPEIRAALKQLKTAVCGVMHDITAADDTPIGQEIAKALRVDMAAPTLPLRALKGWIVEQRVRGIGLTEAVWNDPKLPHRTWIDFEAVPQQRTRLNRVTGEPQLASSPYVFQGLNISEYDKGKWIVVQPDKHIQDFSNRGIMPSLLNDFYGRMNVMGWWQQMIERDAMKTLVARAGSDADAVSLKTGLANRGAAGSFLIRDEKSSVNELGAAVAGRGISVYGEYMTKTAQRMFLALLGESQTGIIEQNAGSKQSAGTQHEIARYVIEDICNDVNEIITRDMFAPWVEINYGPENLVHTPTYPPKLQSAIDIVVLNTAIAGRPANVALGTTWYRAQTQWPEPQKGEEPLDAPVAAAFAAAESKPGGPAPPTSGGSQPPADKKVSAAA